MACNNGGIYNNFPYTDLHNLNLGWLLDIVRADHNVVLHLPQQIQQIVEGYLTSGVLDASIARLLSSYIYNVKTPPEGVKAAAGDGVTDDTDALQQSFDYVALHGKVLFFPAGRYICKGIHLPKNGNFVLIGTGEQSRIDFLGSLYQDSAARDLLFFSDSENSLFFSSIKIDGHAQQHAAGCACMDISRAYLHNTDIIEFSTCVDTKNALMITGGTFTSYQDAITCYADASAEAVTITGARVTCVAGSDDAIGIDFVGDVAATVSADIRGYRTAISGVENSRHIVFTGHADGDLTPISAFAGAISEQYTILTAPVFDSFATVAALQAHDKPMPDGATVKVESYTGNVLHASMWRKIAHSDAPVAPYQVNTATGDTLEYVPDGAPNAAALGFLESEDIGIPANAVLTKYKKLYLPQGFYTLLTPINLGDTMELFGDGHGTILATTDAVTTDGILIANGSFIHVHDFWTIDATRRKVCDGLFIGDNHTLTHSIFENIVFENFSDAAKCRGTAIWNDFNKCAFYGGDIGFYVRGSEGKFFNLNTFNSCRFNNNENEGFQYSGNSTLPAAIDINFNSCNFEKNGYGEVTLEGTNSVTFNNCYFEGVEGGSENDAIVSGKCVNLNGCAFIREPAILFIPSTDDDAYTATFTGCYEFECGDAFYANVDATARVYMIGCHFQQMPANTFVFNDFANKQNTVEIADPFIDCSIPVTFFTHNAIATLQNPIDGQIVTIAFTGVLPCTIAGTLMASGSAFTAQNGKAYQFLVKDSKLIPITTA